MQLSAWRCTAESWRGDLQPWNEGLLVASEGSAEAFPLPAGEAAAAGIDFFQHAMTAPALVKKIGEEGIASGVAGDATVIVDRPVEPRVPRGDFAVEAIQALAPLLLLVEGFACRTFRPQSAKLFAQLLDRGWLLLPHSVIFAQQGTHYKVTKVLMLLTSFVPPYTKEDAL